MAKNASRQQRRRPPRPAAPVIPDFPPSGPLAGIDEERARNQRWPMVACVTAAVVAGVVAALIGLLGGVIVMILSGVIVGVLVGVLLRKATLSAPARIIGAGPIEPGDLPRVETLLEGLSATFGVATPSVALLDDEVVNAAIVSQGSGAQVIVTTGLVRTLSVVELEGVLAHLLAHDRLEAVGRGSVGAGFALLLGPLGRRGSTAHRLTGVGRLFRADELAAVTVRYPVGLASALGKMEAGPVPAKGSLFAAPLFDSLRWLFVDPSVNRRTIDEAFDDVDATSVRRAALGEW